jgi:hypothetical protein
MLVGKERGEMISKRWLLGKEWGSYYEGSEVDLKMSVELSRDNYTKDHAKSIRSLLKTLKNHP